ncbi:hypothetical protein SD71_19090 [Cohnella kolymensis]|uniref:Uncharacterized protein n=1 Tax=Cohnella kolymensis TaxID=1590652 RepID=A0ABR5A0V3_9BACL|nr:hypothetical protein SD71_19090 [Cohnella kolymensis]
MFGQCGSGQGILIHPGIGKAEMNGEYKHSSGSDIQKHSQQAALGHTDYPPVDKHLRHVYVGCPKIISVQREEVD